MSTMNTAPAPFITTGEAGVAPIVATLQKIWTRLQKAQPGLPEATIVVKRDARAWGHTSIHKVWGGHKIKGRGKAKTVELIDGRYEVMISGENLSRGAVETLGTLLHEATHALNLAEGIQDCDSNGRHSKGKFGQRATDVWGLTVKDLGNYLGWTDTSMGKECQKRWAVELRMVEKALAKASVAHHPQAPKGVTVTVPPVGLPGKTKTGGRKKNLTRAVCECEPTPSGWRPSIRASAQVLAIGIRCSACDSDFQVTGE